MTRGTLGSTDPLGIISIQEGLTGKLLTETIKHEAFHSALRKANRFNGNIVELTSKLTGTGKYVEEFAAELYATKDLWKSAKHPIVNGYMGFSGFVQLGIEGSVMGYAANSIHNYKYNKKFN